MRRTKTALTFAAAVLGCFSLTGCPEEEPELFGVISVEVEPQPDETVFAGTATVVATVHYESCLEDFYLNRRPEYQSDGTEGSMVFAEWTERLCSTDEFGVDLPDCEVKDITQNLFTDTDVYSLVITYEIKDPMSIAYREFKIGPLPTEDFAACPDGRPLVELRQTGLLGKDANGSNIWRIASLPDPNSAVAGQGAPLRVKVFEG